MTFPKIPTLRTRGWLYLVLLGVALVAAAPALYAAGVGVSGIVGQIDVGATRDFVRGFGLWAPFASVFLMVVHGLVPFPVEILTVTNGLLFGFWEGVAVTWAGMMLASWAGYLAARHAVRPLALRWVSVERLGKISGWISGSSWKLLAIRQVPVFSFCLLNFALGLLDVPFRRFTWTTALGNLPYIIVVVLASEALARTL
ncbi:MAG: TVP38/TMEM64 family protein [Rubrobacteraceae bacterium]